MQRELKGKIKGCIHFHFTSSHGKAGVLWRLSWYSNSHRGNMIISHIDTLSV